MHRPTPAATSLLALTLAAVTALLAPPDAGACTVILPTTQEQFRDAVRVYEAVALDELFRFRVEKVWRGPEAETVRLSWVAESAGATCSGQDQVVAGRRYLITIECSDPTEGDTFECPARAVDLEYADEKLRYLKEGHPLGPEEVADALGDWLDGAWTTEELAVWVAEMRIVAELDDWVDLGGVLASPTQRAVEMTDYFLSETGDLSQAKECRDRVLREELIPPVLDLLTEEDVALRLEIADEVEMVYWDSWDACEEAFFD